MATATATDLYAHQTRGVDLLVENPRYALWWDTGTGKTATVLRAIERVGGHWLVVCPLVLIENAWMRDSDRFTPHLPIRSLRGAPLATAEHVGVEVINFEQFRTNVPGFALREYTGLIIDESSKMKNPQSQISKRLREFAVKMQYVWLLSGTPAPNDALEYWPQLDAIALGGFGNYYQFRYAYGVSRVQPIGNGKTVKVWSAYAKRMPELMQRVATVSHTLSKDDCLDLPDQVNQTIRVELSPAEQRAYDVFRHTLQVEIGNRKIIAAEALAKVMKLRQFCNGWVYGPDGTIPIGESKMRACLDLLDGPFDLVL
ncbi:MAG: hypothetical protein IH943_10115 [Acidobacteria bacterium]|nr:hypothetical protein [Acidobacteriota bacterium]